MSKESDAKRNRRNRRNRQPESMSESTSENLQREGLPPCRHYLSTGSTLLDLAISDRHPGGIGSGRITHIYGDSSTAKSVLCQEILGSAQRLGGHAIYEDAEGTLDLTRAEEYFGLHVGRWGVEHIVTDSDDPLEKVVGIDEQFTYRIPSSIEQLFEGEIGTVLKLVGEGRLKSPVAMGVDTFWALPSMAEQKASMGDGTYGTSRAKQFSAAFRKYLYGIAQNDLTVVAIDQTRDNIGLAFGPKHTVSGGKAMRFYASTRILLKLAGTIKNKHDVTIGIKVNFTIEKNKIAPPFRKGFFNLLFDYGIDDLTSNLEWLRDNSGLTTPMTRLQQKGSWWVWDDIKEQGADRLVRAIEDENRESEVKDEVVRVWRLLHQPTARKRRDRRERDRVPRANDRDEQVGMAERTLGEAE